MIRTWSIRIAVGLALVLALLFAFREALSVRVMRAAVERNMAADPIGALPDGLHVALCGAGGPLPDPVRSGPCVAVVAGRRLFVVDAGAGSPRNLGRSGWSPQRVEAVFLTHFHSDHIDGLGELALLRWAGAGHDAPLPVHGPGGVAEVVEGFNRAYAKDAGYRVAHHGRAVTPPAAAGMTAHPFDEPPDGESVVVLAGDGLRVTAFRVDHQPVSPAVGYRFDYGGRSVLVSGDTKRSANLAHFAEGVDLLVHEALAPNLVAVMTEAAKAADRPRLAKITVDILDYHTSPAEAAEIAEAAGAGHLLFYHVVPPLPLAGLESAFLEGVSDAYSGGVTLGRDGTLVSLPAGGDAIHVSRLGL